MSGNARKEGCGDQQEDKFGQIGVAVDGERIVQMTPEEHRYYGHQPPCPLPNTVKMPYIAFVCLFIYF